MQIQCVFIEICKMKTKQNKNKKHTNFKLVFKMSSLSPAPAKPSQASRTGYINTGSWSGQQRTALDKGVVQITEPGASLTSSLPRSPWRGASLSSILWLHRGKQGRGGAYPPHKPQSQVHFLFLFCPGFGLTEAQYSSTKKSWGKGLEV